LRVEEAVGTLLQVDQAGQLADEAQLVARIDVHGEDIAGEEVAEEEVVDEFRRVAAAAVDDAAGDDGLQLEARILRGMAEGAERRGDDDVAARHAAKNSSASGRSP
jgi:hypothetical protein